VPVFTKADEVPLQPDTNINEDGRLTDLAFLVQLFNDDQEAINEMVTDFHQSAAANDSRDG
jgi:hypothetical protein